MKGEFCVLQLPLDRIIVLFGIVSQQKSLLFTMENTACCDSSLSRSSYDAEIRLATCWDRTLMEQGKGKGRL